MEGSVQRDSPKAVSQPFTPQPGDLSSVFLVPATMTDKGIRVYKESETRGKPRDALENVGRRILRRKM